MKYNIEPLLTTCGFKGSHVVFFTLTLFSPVVDSDVLALVNNCQASFSHWCKRRTLLRNGEESRAGSDAGRILQTNLFLDLFRCFLLLSFLIYQIDPGILILITLLKVHLKAQSNRLLKSNLCLIKPQSQKVLLMYGKSLSPNAFTKN